MARWRKLFFLVPTLALLALLGPAGAEAESHCTVENAAGPGVASEQAGALPVEGKGNKSKRAKRMARRGKAKPKKRVKLSLQADPGSANRVVNLGSDREAERITLHVNASPRIPKGYGKRLEVVAEPFINSSETADTVTFSEPTFSKLLISGNRKRITFTMCVDPPNNLPAGKYLSTVSLEGPPPTEAATMTITINGKDGGVFLLAAIITAVLAFGVLLYKGAGEKRALLLTAAEQKPAAEKDAAVKQAKKWRYPIMECVFDLGWLVPSIASIAGAFALLYAAYANNPAWGEGGIVTNAIALIGTGLAAVGAKTVFTQSPATH